MGDHQVRAIMSIVLEPGKKRPSSDYGFRLYAAVVDPGAAAGTEGRYGKYLLTPPLSGLDFTWSEFTRTKKMIFDFDEQDRGKTVWFIGRLENAKGKKSSWGALFWTIIP
jgi:hypothetical protein